MCTGDAKVRKTMTVNDSDRILELVAHVRNAYGQVQTGENSLSLAHQLCDAVVDSIKWVSAYPSIKYNWSEEAVSFDCPCGTKDIVLSESGESVTCSCGCVYRLQHYVETNRIPGKVVYD